MRTSRRPGTADGGLRALDGACEALPLRRPQVQDRWLQWLKEAATHSADTFKPSGSAPRYLQAALAAILHTPGNGLTDSIEAAVRVGDDTDTVGAVAGALLRGSMGRNGDPRHLAPDAARSLGTDSRGSGADGSRYRQATLRATSGDPPRNALRLKRAGAPGQVVISALRYSRSEDSNARLLRALVPPVQMSLTLRYRAQSFAPRHFGGLLPVTLWRRA